MSIRFLNSVLSGFLLCGLARAEVSVVHTNKVIYPETVEAMKVGEGQKVSETQQMAEAAEVAEIVRQDAVKKIIEKPKIVDLWEAFEPPPDTEFDWIQLTSGEWLKGDFNVLYDYVIEFDSDELDLQEFDLDDVKRLRTRGMKSVMVQGDEGPRDTTTLRGLLEIRGDQVVLRRSNYEVEASRDQIISIADGRQRERDYWSGMVSIGVNARGGNTKTADATIIANLMRRTALSRFNADYLSNYSKSGDVETANNQRLSGFYDQFLTVKFYWQVLSAEFYRDPFSNIDSQYSLSTGAGYNLIHDFKTEWDINAGAGYQHQTFISVEAGEQDYADSPFVSVGTRFDHEITGNLDFLYDFSLRWLNKDNGQYTHHMLTTFSFDLIQDLDLDVSFIWDRVEKPQAASDGTLPKKDDYQLVISLAYDF